MVVNLRTDEQDMILQQPRIDVVCSLAPRGQFDSPWGRALRREGLVRLNISYPRRFQRTNTKASCRTLPRLCRVLDRKVLRLPSNALDRQSFSSSLESQIGSGAADCELINHLSWEFASVVSRQGTLFALLEMPQV